MSTNEIQAETVQSAFDWIRNGRHKTGPHSTEPDWPGVPVAALIPETFEAYAKIFHPIEAHYENIDRPLAPEERKILGLPECDVLRDFVQLMRSEPGAPALRWKRLAEALGVPFQRHLSDEWFRSVLEPGCWPRYVSGPDEGILEEREATALISILSAFSAFSASSSCYFRFAEMAYIGTDKPLLYSGPLEKLQRFLKETGRQFTPEYWWPGDRSWCVCSDYDLPFTVVGGPKQLINRILTNPDLESIRVTPDTRVDYRAPIE
jgi:hypothetical protein